MDRLNNTQSRLVLITLTMLLFESCISMNSSLSKYSNYSRISESLRPDNITNELTITTEEALHLIKGASDKQLFSSSSGLTSGNSSVQMASMDAGDGSVNKESIFDRKPNTPDVMIEFAQKSATVRLNHEDNSLAWPLDKTKPVKSVYVLPHSESPVVFGDKELYIEQAAKAATHPFVLVNTDNELLILQSLFVVTSHSTRMVRKLMQNTPGIVRKRAYTTGRYGYRTSIFPLNFSTITKSPLSDYTVVVKASSYSIMGRTYQKPLLWFLPVKDGTLDTNRIGYQVVMFVNFIGSVDIPELPGIKAWASHGMVTRVKFSGKK